MSTSSFTNGGPAPRHVRGAMSVLASAKEARARAEEAEAQVLVDAVDWAVANPPLFSRDAADTTVKDLPGRRPGTEPLCAEGIPEVDRAAVAELGLALGTSTQAAQGLIADALELAYRLPGMWARTVAGEVKPWRARQVAQATRPLSRLAAGFVDRQLAPVAHRAGARMLEQLVAAAVARFDPQVAEEAEAARAYGRFVRIEVDQTDLGGLTPISGVVDVPDALDLQAALTHGAAQLAEWGSAECLDARRARALGDLARQHLAWNGQPVGVADAHAGTLSDDIDGGVSQDTGRAAFDPTEITWGAENDEASAPQPVRVPPKRQIVLYLHLTDTTLRRMLEPGCHESGAVGSGLMGRAENTGTPVTAGTIQEWCSDAATRVSVRTVIDLEQSLHADGYEIPARLREQIRLRDGTCIFPGCHAKALSCQDDHEIPYNHADPASGGRTESGNLRLLCQRHHNLKTHHGFSYTTLANGAVLWRTPHGLRVRVGTDGTTTIEGLPRSPNDEPPEP